MRSLGNSLTPLLHVPPRPAIPIIQIYLYHYLSAVGGRRGPATPHLHKTVANCPSSASGYEQMEVFSCRTHRPLPPKTHTHTHTYQNPHLSVTPFSPCAPLPAKC